jgi:transposase-like protein
MGELQYSQKTKQFKSRKFYNKTTRNFYEKSRYTDIQIINILKQNQAGESVANLYREYGMSQATFYKWRSKYGDADVNVVKRLKRVRS